MEVQVRPINLKVQGRHGKGFVLTGNDGRMEVRPVNPEVQGNLWMEAQVRPVNPEVQGRHLP